MEVDQDVRRLAGLPAATEDDGSSFKDLVLIITSEFLTRRHKQQPVLYTMLCQAIDKIGVLSAKAQLLARPITEAQRLSEHRLYLCFKGRKMLGILKVGTKKLFYMTSSGHYLEMEPLCVLDFYVHESVQRMGIGLKLFEYMLEQEGTQPELLAYDRPSPKLIAFLGKHYGLRSFMEQANSFVIFDAFFRTREGKQVMQSARDGKRTQSIYRWKKNTELVLDPTSPFSKTSHIAETFSSYSPDKTQSTQQRNSTVKPVLSAKAPIMGQILAFDAHEEQQQKQQRGSKTSNEPAVRSLEAEFDRMSLLEERRKRLASAPTGMGMASSSLSSTLVGATKRTASNEAAFIKQFYDEKPRPF